MTTKIEAAPVDVLAVLDAMVLSAERLAAGEAVTACAATVDVARQTRAAVAELIEAHREYDEAKEEHDARASFDETGISVPRAVYERMEAATARLAAALSRVGGAK